MPSHIYIRVGDHELSATVNETAADVDKKYIERTGAKGIYPLMYYSHNLHFVSYARMAQGRFEDALDYSRRLRKNVDGAIDDMPMLAPYGAFQWMVLTRFGKWEEMLAEPEPKEKTAMMHAFYRYARGLAYAGLNKVPEARAERERMEAICARIPEEEKLMINTSRSVAAVGLADLDARIARAMKDGDAEIGNLNRAVELQDKLGYMEPPEWHYSMREALGAALLRQGKASEAETVFRKDLDMHPRSGRSLFGLMEALQMQKKSASLDWVKREFEDAWKHSAAPLKVEDL
jgi:tetratricopeptide (TPR) repeat protein